MTSDCVTAGGDMTVLVSLLTSGMSAAVYNVYIYMFSFSNMKVNRRIRKE